MKKLQSDTIRTKQVRIDAEWVNALAYLRADLHVSMKSLVEEALSKCYAWNAEGKPYRIGKASE